ncbi:MAG: amidase [Rhodospirillaceae bacterium]|nr:amidase [Rhodospirillaceae bacterium]MBT3883783.1 amidase [Rhodospirillaceae bacterium]MBT4115642.1 amidase [Rhodospirillaceae bacterium]MBT4750859.1 amidase [Rhodospirillaceae bacterium]MBT5179462.1 amidase [Rhodospirillaceae bacterium]
MPNDPVNAFVPHTPPLLKGAGAGPLAGLTFAVKDLYDTEGDVTGGGNPRWLASHGPAQNTSPLVAKLLEAGADMTGKTICDELFYSFTGANAHYGTPTNCRAPLRMPGGSSSGSAAATAAGLCDFALGSDTGGSVRAPASFCGIFGLRPTHGRLDLAHAMAMAPSFDTAGWFAGDAALLQRIGDILLGAGGVTHGVDKVLVADFAFQRADAGSAEALREFLGRAADALGGTETLPSAPGDVDLDDAREAFRVIQAFEVWDTFGDWVRAEAPTFGPGISERMATAATVTPADRDQAMTYRNRLRDAFGDTLTPGTVMILPTAASPPPLLDTPEDALDRFRSLSMGLLCLAPLAGLPQISVPAASLDGVPVGLGIMGWEGGDEALLGMASALAPYCQSY